MNYTDKVKELFLHPKNMGEIADASGTAEVGNPVCGDVMKMDIKVDPKTQKITDIKFKTFGCAAAIATSSMITQLAKDKVIEDAQKIKAQDVWEALGGLPQLKKHCGSLAVQALQAAIKDYLTKNK